MATADITAPPTNTPSDYIAAALPALVDRIDREEFYPREILRGLGARGGFGADSYSDTDAFKLDLVRQIGLIAQVGSVCGSTAFLVWCQSTCIWYLQHSAQAAVRRRYLKAVVTGERPAGTGMSNAVKHLAGIEKIRLHARRQGDSYIVDGVLPWLSNLSEDGLIFVAASVAGEGYVMFAIEADSPGLTLHPCPEFSGMRGTNTLNVRFKQVALGADNVLAQPAQFDDFISRIRAGFMLMQAGMGLGVGQACLRVMRESNISHAQVNTFLNEQAGELQQQIEALRARIDDLAATSQSDRVPALQVLRARAAASELALRAAQSATLHAGARGYLMRHPAQRLMREATFVAIVTPALKHLRKEIHDLELTEGHAIEPSISYGRT